MQIKPLAQASVPNADIGEARTPADKIARAKAVMMGQSPDQAPTGDPQSDRIQSIRKIKMRTQVSPDRPITEGTSEEVQGAAESAIPDTGVEESAEQVEERKPLSPQFAALAKQQRALQVKERELAEREAKLSELTKGPNPDEFLSKAELIANPLKIFEAGITYDQLTEAILSGQPANANPDIRKLQSDLEAKLADFDKKLSDRDAQAEQQVLVSLKKDADSLAYSSDEFELVRETKSTDKAVELVHRTWKEKGELMDIQEAMKLVEDELLADALKAAHYKKVQSKLGTAQAPSKPAQPQQQQQFRTLTNKDTARPAMDRRSRAIAAALGQLKR